MCALKSPIPQVMSNTNRFCLVQWKNPAVNWLLEHRPELFKKSPTTYYFAKRDSNEMICEKILRLNILPNQFYAALAIFSAPKCGGLRTPNFRSGEIQPPCPLPCSAISANKAKMQLDKFGLKAYIGAAGSRW